MGGQFRLLITLLLVWLYSFSIHAQVPVPSKAQLIKEIRTLYPHFTQSQIDAKIASEKSADGFFRAFVPLYFNSVKDNPQMIGQLANLGSESGWCVGDAHFANFGVLLDDQNNPKFTINDMDDAGPCPLVTDILRPLVSANLSPLSQSLPFLELLRRYEMGLTQTPYQYGAATTKLLRDGKALGRVPDPSKLAAPNKLVRKSTDRELTSEERAGILDYTSKILGSKSQVLDAKAYEKDDGGSFGLTVIVMLVQFDTIILQSLNLTNPQILVFKQQVWPGVFPFIQPNPIPPTNYRISTTLRIEQGPRFSKLYNVTRFTSKDWLVKPDWNGQIKPNQKTTSAQDKLSILLDEFYTLGFIHSMTASARYGELVSKSNPQSWYEATVLASRYFAQVFNNLR